jgi:hypothetical protein
MTDVLARCSGPDGVCWIAGSRTVDGAHRFGCQTRIRVLWGQARRRPCLLELHAPLPGTSEAGLGRQWWWDTVGFVDSDDAAEGWYEDPYRLHQHRWFSAGRPSSLVRDNGVESKEAPPDEVFEGPLIPAATDAATDGADLRRADDAQANPFDSNKFWDAAVDAATWNAPTP